MRSELKLSPRLPCRAGGVSFGGSGTVESRRAPRIDRAPGDKPGSGRFVGRLIGDEHGTGMVAISS
jgi:hypothetical protein